MAFIGKVLHASVDLVLVSTCLAGIKRNTGLSLKLDNLQDGAVRDYTLKWLNLGEATYDYAVATCGSSSYFQRR